MPRAILVPVDGSSFAEHALPHGLAIARRTGATLHVALVHVPADVTAPAYPLADVIEATVIADRDREVAYMDGLTARFSRLGVDVQPALLRGRVPDALSRYCDREPIDLIVMTTHGRGGLERAWLGSTADSLVRRAHRPVLLVRPTEETRDLDSPLAPAFRRVVAALDGSEAAEQALADAATLGLTAEAGVLLLHVIDPPGAEAGPPYPVQLAPEEVGGLEVSRHAYLRAVGHRLASAGRLVEPRIVAEHDPGRAILRVAADERADLIVMGTHGRGGLSRVLLGSVADRVIRATDRTVLVRRARAAAPQTDNAD